MTTAAVHAYYQHGRSIEGFFVRNEAKKHGTKKMIEGCLRPGWKVVIVDDVVTRGKSVLKAVDAVRKAECEPILILTLVDRLEGAAQEFQRLGIRYESVFTIEHFLAKLSGGLR